MYECRSQRASLSVRTVDDLALCYAGGQPPFAVWSSTSMPVLWGRAVFPSMSVAFSH
jgi:hypothetical protein